MSGQERTVYIRGEFVPESKAVISIRDLGFVHGDAAFDTARTFNGTIFKLTEHVDRLYQSCKFLRIDPGISKEQMVSLTQELVKRNVPLLGPNDDYWVTQRVTRGEVDTVPLRPTVLVECRPLPLSQRAKYYRSGIALMPSSLRRTSSDMLSPQAKTHNYLNVVLADLEVKSRDDDAWVVLLDDSGNLAEGSSNNVFIVKDGILATPRSQLVLDGITRRTVLDIAKELEVSTIEEDIDQYAACNADEMFITSSSLCICPVSSFNGIPIGDGRVPGPLTMKLMSAFSDLVGLDYVAQYLAHESQ